MLDHKPILKKDRVVLAAAKTLSEIGYTIFKVQIPEQKPHDKHVKFTDEDEILLFKK